MKNISETVKEHTPTPWAHTHQTDSDFSHDVVAVKLGRVGQIVAICGTCQATDSEAAANARFIVTACNAHEALLDACKVALVYPQPPLVEKALRHAILLATTT